MHLRKNSLYEYLFFLAGSTSVMGRTFISLQEFPVMLGTHRKRQDFTTVILIKRATLQIH